MVIFIKRNNIKKYWWFLFVWIASIPLEQKTNLNCMRKSRNKDFCSVIMPSGDI